MWLSWGNHKTGLLNFADFFSYIDGRVVGFFWQSVDDVHDIVGCILGLGIVN